MYEIDNKDQFMLPVFSLPFGGKLSSSNRWVKLSKKIEWDKIEQEYSSNFSKKGKRAIKCRPAYASLIIKELLSISDRETIEQIYENPYLQYFCGYTQMLKKRPFSASALHIFRGRFPSDIYSKKYINKMIRRNKRT